MFSCTCPRCHASNEDEDLTKCIIKIPHTVDCAFKKGMQTRFDAIEIPDYDHNKVPLSQEKPAFL